MIKKFSKIFHLFILFFFLSIIFCQVSLANHKEKIEVGEDGLYIENISTEGLELLFKSLDYNDYIYMPDWKYPPVFLEHIPYDFDTTKDENKRNNLFLRLMIPLVLKTNDEILFERYNLLSVIQSYETNKEFSEEDEKFLEEKATKYDVFTRLKGIRRYQYLMEELDKRIDIVSPSILIAIAAVETNWGTSASLKKANSLYKEKTWYSDEGLEVDDKNDKSYKIKIYKNLLDSIKDYALRINSNKDYIDFRMTRKELKSRNHDQNGRRLAPNLFLASGLENYAGLIDYTITFYELTNIDGASLGFID